MNCLNYKGFFICFVKQFPFVCSKLYKHFISRSVYSKTNHEAGKWINVTDIGKAKTKRIVKMTLWRRKGLFAHNINIIKEASDSRGPDKDSALFPTFPLLLLKQTRVRGSNKNFLEYAKRPLSTALGYTSRLIFRKYVLTWTSCMWS